jgi:hypothetical protein
MSRSAAESEPTIKRVRFPQGATFLAEAALKITNALLESTFIWRRAKRRQLAAHRQAQKLRSLLFGLKTFKAGAAAHRKF